MRARSSRQPHSSAQRSRPGGDRAPGGPAANRAAFIRSAQDAFGAYHDLYAVGTTVSRLGDRFEAAVVARRAAGLLLFDRQVAGAVHEREASRVRRDDLEHVNVQVLRSGRMLAGEPGAERLLAGGDAVLFDTTRPQRTVLYDADYVTVALARGVVEAAVPDIRALHGRILSRDAFPGLAEAVLSCACGSGDSVDAGRGGSLLIAGSLAPAGGPPAWENGAGDEAEAARRMRALLFIDAHLGREDLDVHAVAAGSGISRSSLYRAFAPVGGVGREILRRRAARLRAALLRTPEEVGIATLARALGFTSPSHGSRTFKAVYGLTPGQLRAEIRSTPDAVVDLEPGRLRGWIDGLSRPRPAT